VRKRQNDELMATTKYGSYNLKVMFSTMFGTILNCTKALITNMSIVLALYHNSQTKDINLGQAQHCRTLCEFPIECSFPTPYSYTNRHDIEISADI
jgi:hypothetical protein